MSTQIRSPRQLPNPLPFFFPHVIPLLSIAFHYSSSEWHALIPVVFVWVVVPVFDFIIPKHLLRRRHAPLTLNEKRHLDSHLSFRLTVWLWPLTQFSVFMWAAHRVSTASISPFRLLALLCSLTLSAAEGVNCAHELIHRNSRLERFLGDALLSSVCYGHFGIEHTRGHHFRVATPDDPATLSYGQSFYTFFPRAVVGGFRSAWSLEAQRLSKRGLPIISIHNRIVINVIIQATIPVVLWFVFGLPAVALFLFQSITTIVLLEQVNAIEHYGLSRARRADGSYEPVGPRHSWDAPHSISNYLLFKLQLHADHHLRMCSIFYLHLIKRLDRPQCKFKAKLTFSGSDCLCVYMALSFLFFACLDVSRRYQSLQLTEGSPQLPAGYLSLAPILFVPPLWRAVMHPVLERYQKEWEIEDANAKISQEVVGISSSASMF